MKMLLLIAAILFGMAVVGWINFSNSSDRTTITIEKDEIKQDTRDAVDEAKELYDDEQDDREQPQDSGEYDPDETEHVPEETENVPDETENVR